jgi:hypothetical protein
MYRSIRRLLVSVMICLGCVVVSATASATTYAIHGGSCVPFSPSGNATYSQYGISNNGSGSLSVICPIVILTGQFSQLKMILDGYNRSTTNSSCTVSATDDVGAGIVSGTASLTGNHPGSLEASPVVLNLNLSQYYYETFSIICSIAPYNPSSGGSWITEISLTTTP